MATRFIPTITAVCIAFGLAGCGDPTAATRQSLDMHIANYQRLRAEADQEEYAGEVRRYGQKAVVECRSRGLPHDAYWYCLSAQRPDVTPTIPLNTLSSRR